MLLRVLTPLFLSLLVVACIDDASVDKDPDGGDPDGGDTDSGDTGEMLVTFIDVGQGDSTLLELPGGAVVLVDGGDNGAGYGAILPLLDEKGIETIDLLVLTHPHKDHCGGLDEVLLAMDVLEIWENGETLPTETYTEYAAARDAEGAQLETPSVGYTQSFGPVSFEVLHSDKGYEDENNDSIVLQIVFDQVTVLLTGDIEEEAQQYLANIYGSDLACEAIKVPHHGSSDYSPQFVDMASPRYAVISCGEDNPFGHPHQEAIDAYLDEVDELCVTMEAGDVAFWTDGGDVQFDCASPRLP
jgi:beta-lactamase superfamily II metal-dependent hydrolase